MKKILTISALTCSLFSSLAYGENLLLSPDFWETASAEDVNSALADGADVNAQTKGGYTPLMFVMYKDSDPVIIDRLISLGADCNAEDKKGRTVLMFAARVNPNPELIERMVKLGADVNAKDNEGETALIYAASRNNPEVVERLVQLGADVNAREEEHGYTVLMFSAMGNSDPKVIERLVKLGADVDARNKSGNTALMLAAVGNTTGVEMLVSLGADVNASLDNGNTVLMLAVLQRQKNPSLPRLARNADIIERLLKLGADVSCTNKLAQTALDLAEKGSNDYQTLMSARKPQSGIVFSKGNVGDRGIRSVKPDMTDVKQLTREKRDHAPTWSPDGDSIAFLATREADYELLAKYRLCMHSALYIMDGKGGGQRRIVDVPLMIFEWSPDSQHIAFISGYENSENYDKDGIEKSSLYVVDIQGSKPQRLTDVDGKLQIGMSWSPSGCEIAYSAQVAAGKYDIFTVNADRPTPKRIATGTNPVWSPDGKRILFLIRGGRRPTSTTGIHSVDRDGGNQEQVSTAAGYVRLIGFSPDGERILYVSNSDVYAMDSDGSNKVNLTKGMFKAIDIPQFIEHGTKVFLAGRKDREWELFSIGIEGAN
ncbi:ankyrin repeat domain-containing protein [Pontiellaceae bacterium B12227]|nr:ankyrin repeat domain-containing protein [Pontiellaceae bacterium B12227]